LTNFIDICDVIVIAQSEGRVGLRDINEGAIEHDHLEFIETDNLFADLTD